MVIAEAERGREDRYAALLSRWRTSAAQDMTLDLYRKIVSRGDWPCSRRAAEQRDELAARLLNYLGAGEQGRRNFEAERTLLRWADGRPL